MPKAQAPDPHPAPFVVRDYLPTDFDLLLKIDGGCFALGMAYSPEELADFIDHPASRTWVAEGNGEVVGFLVATKVQTRRLHIVTLDVVEGWRRRGAGRALMAVAENLARREKRSVVSLETAEDNHRAQAFYRALGFRKVRWIDSYYSDGTAAWLMLKNLV
ncbi:MAG: GNAT family N-acetyltransferase [Terriglobia bacterium]